MIDPKQVKILYNCIKNIALAYFSSKDYNISEYEKLVQDLTSNLDEQVKQQFNNISKNFKSNE